MNKKFISFMIITILIFSVVMLVANKRESYDNADLEIIANSRPDGSVDFQIRTLSYNGAYAPAHCLAIWVCDDEDNFQRTLVRRAWSYIQHLVKWNQMTNGDDTNAIITGASPTMHTLWTVNWDCKDRFGEEVPDGNYRVYVEFTEDNSLLIPVNGPWTMVEFTKGDQPEVITPAGNQFYQDISLSYEPASSSDEDINPVVTDFYNFPNPFNPDTSINYSLKNDAQVTIDIYNSLGQKVYRIDEGYKLSGINHSVSWNGKDSKLQDCSSGVYIFELSAGEEKIVRKATLLK